MLSIFLLRGLTSINEITKNINLKKTTLQFLKNQLPEEINKSFLKIEFTPTQKNIDETFFTFLKKNDTFFKNLKIINLDEKEETLNNHLDSYFKNMHSKYNEDKLFFFYFQLILMELFLSTKNIALPRIDLKNKLENILKNTCFRQKNELKECLGKHVSEIDVITMSEFGNKVENKCKITKKSLEQCVINNYKVLI